MRSFIIIADSVIHTDGEGFAQSQENILAETRAYKEERHGNEVWKNRAAFSESTCLFRFRTIPGVVVSTSHSILCDGQWYRILSVEDVRSRGMYTELLAQQIQPSMR
jgi:hypothetical protein